MQEKKSGIKERKKRTELRNGIAEGEKQKQIEIAKRMINKGKPIEEISELTDLAEEEINKLFEKY